MEVVLRGVHHNGCLSLSEGVGTSKQPREQRRGCLSRVRPATCPATARVHLYQEMATLWPHKIHACK